MIRPRVGVHPHPIHRASPVLAGLMIVGFALVWSETHPARPILELVGSPAFDAGVMPRGTYGRHSWAIRNVGAEPLRLRTRFTSGHSGFSLWLGEDHVIPPGRRIIVHLTWAIPAPGSQPFADYATIGTNDPIRPEFRLRVVGTSGSANTRINHKDHGEHREIHSKGPGAGELILGDSIDRWDAPETFPGPSR